MIFENVLNSLKRVYIPACRILSDDPWASLKDGENMTVKLITKAPEINELENRKRKLINAFRIWLFKKVDDLEKPLARLIKKRKTWLGRNEKCMPLKKTVEE